MLKTMYGKIKSDRLFVLLYYAGLTLATAIAVSGAQKQLFAGRVYFADYSEHIFAAALIHMLVLIAAGFVIARDKALAGSRVQTAGYLHTLIGFSVAMAHVSVTQDFSAGQVMVPLSAALITSILGWLFGGEIATRAAAASAGDVGSGFDVLRSATELLAETMGKTASGIKKFDHTLVDLSRHLEGAKHKTSHWNGALTKTVEQTRKIADTMASFPRDEFREQTKFIPLHLGQLNAGLNGATASAVALEDYLKASEMLLQRLEKLIEKTGRDTGPGTGSGAQYTAH